VVAGELFDVQPREYSRNLHASGHNPAAMAASLPQRRWPTVAWYADFERQLDAEAKDGPLQVDALVSSFVGFRDNSARNVLQNDGRCRFVAMLPPRPTAHNALDLALCE
jgi:hypothetical protein